MNAPKFDVIGIGRNCVDHLAVMETLPRRDTKAPMLQYVVAPGGQSSTAAAALSRLGLKCACAGLVGDDPDGAFLKKCLREEGVDDTKVLAEPGARTPVALILVEAGSGKRTIAYLDSLRGRLKPERFDFNALLSTRCLLIDPYATSLGARLAPLGRERGVVTIYDAEHEVEDFEKMLETSDYIIGSEQVVETLGETGVEAALKKLFSYGPRAAVITLGEKGCAALGPEGILRRKAYAVKAVDTTAAGDAFHAGFAFGVLKGWELPRLLEFASALGALVCRGLGGRASLPTLDEVFELVKDGPRTGALRPAGFSE